MPYKDTEYHREYRIKRYTELTEFLREYKVKHGCTDCGYNDNHAGLEFDHVRGVKFKNVTSMLNYTKARVLEEIAKCDVVCGTCHRIRTFERKQQTHGGRNRAVSDTRL